MLILQTNQQIDDLGSASKSNYIEDEDKIGQSTKIQQPQIRQNQPKSTPRRNIHKYTPP